jgi:hypothetical protein
MRKSLIRFAVASAAIFAVFGQASAQSSVQFWYNKLGDATNAQPSVINVTSGSNVTLSVYARTTGVGPLSAIGVLFGYSTSTTMGPAAVAADSKASLVSFTWDNANYSGGQLFGATAGGGGVASGNSRPWGLSAQTGTLSTFAGTGDGIDMHVLDITLHINASGPDTIPINLWSVSGVDSFTSVVYNANGSPVFPSQPYTGTLNIQAVPEPATLAILGMGGLALLRRRRASK